MFFVNKVWNDNMGKYGTSDYGSYQWRIIIVCCKTYYQGWRRVKSAISKLNAVCGGIKYNYGTETRIKIEKST